MPVQVLADAAVVQWDTTLGRVARLTLAGDRTLAAPTGLAEGEGCILEVQQDVEGGRRLALAPAISSPPAGASLHPAPGAITVLGFMRIAGGVRFLGAGPDVPISKARFDAAAIVSGVLAKQRLIDGTAAALTQASLLAVIGATRLESVTLDALGLAIEPSHMRRHTITGLRWQTSLAAAGDVGSAGTWGIADAQIDIRSTAALQAELDEVLGTGYLVTLQKTGDSSVFWRGVVSGRFDYTILENQYFRLEFAAAEASTGGPALNDSMELVLGGETVAQRQVSQTDPGAGQRKWKLPSWAALLATPALRGETQKNADVGTAWEDIGTGLDDDDELLVTGTGTDSSVAIPRTLAKRFGDISASSSSPLRIQADDGAILLYRTGTVLKAKRTSGLSAASTEVRILR